MLNDEMEKQWKPIKPMKMTSSKKGEEYIPGILEYFMTPELSSVPYTNMKESKYARSVCEVELTEENSIFPMKDPKSSKTDTEPKYDHSGKMPDTQY